ncbi:MAG: hypothetical protein ABIW46_08080 [Acidimicrobiales bacterium]
MPSLSISLDPGSTAVAPGSASSRVIRVRNDDGEPADVRFEVLGFPGDWASTIPPRLTVPAHASSTAQLTVRPPVDPDVRPGPFSFQVRAVPVADPGGSATVEGRVDVAGRAALRLQVTPPRGGGRRAAHRLTVENRGNVGTTATVTASDPSPGLAVRLGSSRVGLGPGDTAEVKLAVRRRRGRGRGRSLRVDVTVRPDGAATGGATAEVVVHRPPRRRRRPVLALLVLVALGAGATGLATRGGGPDGGAGPPPPVPRYAVGLRTEPFVDTSRPTSSHGDFPGERRRPLPTVVLYPTPGPPTTVPVDDADPLRTEGVFPLLVFAHGTNGEVMKRYGPLLRSWAAAGYVVAAPTFPFATNPQDTSSDDYPNQPADISFVTDELLRLNGDPASPLAGLIDPDRIGAVGSALGGITTLGLTSNACCRDARFKAAAVFASYLAPFGDSEYFTEPGPPLLVIHGDRDDTIAYADARHAFTDGSGPSFLVTILGGDHATPYVGEIDGPQIRVTLAATLDFFDHFLRGDDGALDRLEDHVDEGETARLERRS